MALIVMNKTPAYSKNITIDKGGNVRTEHIDANQRDWMEFIEAQGRIPVDRFVPIADRGKLTERNFLDYVKRPEDRAYLENEIKSRRQASLAELEAQKRMKPQTRAEERFAESMVRMAQSAQTQAAQPKKGKGNAETE